MVLWTGKDNSSDLSVVLWTGKDNSSDLSVSCSGQEKVILQIFSVVLWTGKDNSSDLSVVLWTGTTMILQIFQEFCTR